MITILLSTYNGEKYLDQQIESLLAQECVELQIVVRDDGSTDGTHQILERWQQRGALSWYSGENLGFAMSFMELLCVAPKSQYYAYCDQDDLWLPNKLFEALRVLDESSSMLYCSNLRLYYNTKIGGVMHPIAPIITLERSLVSSVATGCTMLFVEELRDIIVCSSPSRLWAHDLWTLHSALLFGDVVYDPNALILYRQHGANQIGAKVSLVARWRSRWRSLSRLSGQHYREDESRELIRCYGDLLDSDTAEILQCVASYRKSLVRRLRLLFSRKYVAQSFGATFWVKVRVILGRL